MHKNVRTVAQGGFSLTEVIIVVLVLGVIASMVLPAISRAREEDRRIKCRNNLNQLAKGMASYIEGWRGDSRFFPTPLGRTRNPKTYNGAEWLASLYWVGIESDPSVYICPSSGDGNRDGIDIGLHTQAATFGSRTVSYAGMHYESGLLGAAARAGAIRDDYPPNKPMASDDTQGDINHDGGMAILFFDSHVEFRTNTELDLEHAVGDTRPDALLKELSN